MTNGTAAYSQKAFTQSLKKYYGIYTGCFISFVVVLAIAAHKGFAQLSRSLLRPTRGARVVVTLAAAALAVQLGLYLGREGLDGDYTRYFAPSLPPGTHVAEFVAYGLLTALVLLLLPGLRLDRT